MIIFKDLDHKELELCFELDSNTLCLWTKKQWEYEFNKRGVRVVAILFRNKIIGIDEAQINYFAINQKYRRKGFGSNLMSYVINQCKKLSIKKLILEVSDKNSIAEAFYSKFNFLTVGKRKNYYKDGSDAVLKEKILQNNSKYFFGADNQNL